ncbi:hypothetical protein TNCV_395891 [Trichonephila clavipes]|nr:hypothetical protein TNCV_395891 [Trichonephila clavipes]
MSKSHSRVPSTDTQSPVVPLKKRGRPRKQPLIPRGTTGKNAILSASIPPHQDGLRRCRGRIELSPRKADQNVEKRHQTFEETVTSPEIPEITNNKPKGLGSNPGDAWIVRKCIVPLQLGDSLNSRGAQVLWWGWWKASDHPHSLKIWVEWRLCHMYRAQS